MSDNSQDIFPIPDESSQRAHVGSMEEYREIYDRFSADREAFWREQAGRLDWMEPFDQVLDCSFQLENLHIEWFKGGTLNASVNCLDRHVRGGRGEKAALIFEPDDPSRPSRSITYAEALGHVQRLANVLRNRGVTRGDRVTLYLPMIPEAAYAMLACARIGAIFSTVFAGFSADSLIDRILDCESDFVITADQGRRGGKIVNLKDTVDKALEKTPQVRHVLVVRNTGGDVGWREDRDLWLQDELENVADDCEPEPMGSEDPLFILYTSGSTGKPKGVVHTTAGYVLFTSLTHELVFDIHDDDVFWCTADVGWITGHSYIVFGPMANGCTQVFFEGTPTYPDAGRLWEVVDKHGVTAFYTAPTAIRALMAQGDDFVTRTSRESLRVLGTVGEPINPEAWRWYHRVVGNGNVPIVDTWWQTETGGIMITALPGAIPQKPGSATLPFFGIRPVILNEQGEEQMGEAEGLLAIDYSWPGQARTVYRDHERFKKTYFERFPGYYLTGDGCRRDADGYHWITGRVDDVINVSGHRMGTAEVESALVLHPEVAEAAVVGFPHEVKGQGIYAYVTLNADADSSDDLREELVQHVREVIGPIATPDAVHFTPALPKTRSGKIMRRILRSIAANKTDDLGDTSTLADPEVVDSLVRERKRS